MIQNYFKIAWRNLNKHRFFSLVNICGLAIGSGHLHWMMRPSYVTDEWSYDRSNEKAGKPYISGLYNMANGMAVILTWPSPPSLMPRH